MLRFVARAMAACTSVAAIALLAFTASAQGLPVHPVIGGAGPDESEVGTNPENPIEPGFGWAVAIRDEHAFIGLPFGFSGGVGGFPEGRVGVFTATPTALLRTGTLTATVPVPDEQFGLSLAFRDGVLVVGARSAVYIFQRSNGVWTQRQRLTAPATDDVDSFPNSFRYEDGTLAIGANLNDVSGVRGAVYIYQRNAAGKFAARGKLAFNEGSRRDGFGSSISMAGPVMVVGAPGLGRAYVFRRSSTGVWRQHQTLLASEHGAGGAAFGATVAIDRGMIIVGAPGADADDPFHPVGAAYGFVAGSGVYIETFKLQPGPTQITCCLFFGQQLAMFGERIVVGAQRINSSDSHLNGFAIFTYTRAGSSVMARGVATGEPFHFASTSLSLANQRLLVGIPCTSTFPSFCPGSGKAELYKLNVLQ